MGNWFYEGKHSVQFTVDNVTKDSWEDFKMIPEKKPVMQAPDLGLRLFKRFEFSQTYIIEDNDEVDNIIDDIIEYLHGKTGSITVGENTYTALFNVVDISAEDHYTTFRLQAILSDFDPEDPDNTLDFGDFNTWTDWHLIPDETLKIVPPQLKEKYVDIPGRNGAIDLCNAVVGLPRFERMTGSLSFTIYDNDPETIYNDMLDNLHGHKFDEVEIMGKSYDGRWVIESYEPDGEEPKITLGYNLILHDWTFNEDGDGTTHVYVDGFIGFIDHFPGKSIPPDLTSDNSYQAQTQFKSVTSQSVTYEIFGYFHSKKKYARLVDIPGVNYFRICFETDGDDNTDFKLSVSYNNWDIASYPTGTSYVFPHDEWITIGIVIDANGLRLYKNGELVETRSDFTSASLPNKTLDYWTYNLGYTTELSGRYLTGCIETFRLYDRALTPEELFGNYKTDISKMKIYGINCNQQSLGGGSA